MQSLHQLHSSFKRVGLHYIDFVQHRPCRHSAYPAFTGENSQFCSFRDEPRLGMEGSGRVAAVGPEVNDLRRCFVSSNVDQILQR